MVVLKVWWMMKEDNGVLGMFKCTASRSGSKYVIGREYWKALIVNKLWMDAESNDL